MKQMAQERIEQEIIAAILMWPKSIGDVREELRPSVWLGKNARIIGAMLDCAARGVEINLDNVLVISKVSIGDMPLVQGTSLDLRVLTKMHAEAVVNSKMNGLRVAINSKNDAFENLALATEAVDESNAIIHSFGRRGKQLILEDYLTFLAKMVQRQITRYTTGLPTLDRLLRGGISDGSYTLIGGFPGIGKTSVLLNMMLAQAKSGIRVGLIEGEMIAEEILLRLQGIMTGQWIDDIETGRRADWKAELMAFCDTVHSLPVEFSFPVQRSNESLSAEIVRLAEAGCRVIYVDYLQVFATKSGAAKDEFSQIKKTSEMIRSLSLRFKVAIVAASSLNRIEGSNRPSLQSFYGSSGLGHDASVAIALVPVDTELERDPVQGAMRDVVFDVMKARNAMTDEFQVRYWLQTQKIGEVIEAFSSPTQPQLCLTDGRYDGSQEQEDRKD
mgnify:CR=1 FL=1